MNLAENRSERSHAHGRRHVGLGAAGSIDVAPALWSSFNRDKLPDFPELMNVVNYLSAPR